MNAWLQFLTSHGARLSQATEASTPALEFGTEALPPVPERGFVAPLIDFGLIAASGDDAATFLHNQLTNDIEHLGGNEARLAGYCSPKGRLLATLLTWKTPDAIYLELPAALQAAIQKRLQMFVLRAKVKLDDATARHAVIGLAGQQASHALAHWFDALPPAPMNAVTSAAGTLIRLADSPLAPAGPRYQWIAPVDTAIAAWPQLTAVLAPAGPRAWRLSEIGAGVPTVTLPTQDQFVPQMINFEAIGGVNFRKGCYPGQEVVARSQYLGKLKRRMQRAVAEAAGIVAGTEVFAAGDPSQPCGMVVNAELRSPGLTECLVELKSAVVEAGESLHAGAINGPLLTLTGLPYTLPAAE